MLADRYGNPLSISSGTARDAYIEGVDLFLSANAGADIAFEKAIAAEENFVLAHLGLARHYQVHGESKAAQKSLSRAEAFTQMLSDQEKSHLAIFGALLRGDSKTAYSRVRAHLLEYPRDGMIAQTCMGVFGLIGFSGKIGREAEQLAFSETLSPHYGDDWWFLSALAFSQLEVGQFDAADANIERSIALNPRNANVAHHRAHLCYELGESEAGSVYLQEWIADYDKRSILHGHLYWHLALWALGTGSTDNIWEWIDSHVGPGASYGSALNQLTDTAAILFRAELAGMTVPEQRWVTLSQYAAEKFTKPGLVFADVHAALAHAMAGDDELLSKIIMDSAGPTADIVSILGTAFRAIAMENWIEATTYLVKIMAQHERIGGSRAQRDLIEHALVSVLLRSGQTEEARRLLSMRRPLTMTANVVKGLWE